MSADEAEVRHANLGLYRAFEALDLGRMAAAWSEVEPVSCLHPGWAIAEGRAEVMRSWRTIFENTEHISFEVRDERVEVRGELAWVVCTEVIRAPGGDGEAVEGALRATNVFRKEGGVWKVVHHHASPFVSSPRPKSASRSVLH